MPEEECDVVGEALQSKLRVTQRYLLYVAFIERSWLMCLRFCWRVEIRKAAFAGLLMLSNSEALNLIDDVKTFLDMLKFSG